MIRINLLPQKKRPEARKGGQGWLVVLLLLSVAQAVGFILFHVKKGETLKAQKSTNAALQLQIDKAKKAVADHARVKEKVAALKAREDAIAKLQSARTGPTAALLELARLLTPGRGPSVDPHLLERLRRENPTEVFNPSWDGRRLWLVSFVEKQRLMRLQGVARDGEDVSELARRMTLSSFFDEVKFLPAHKGTENESGIELVQFQLQAKVKY